MNGDAIRLAGIDVRYRDRLALDGVDLAIDAGERVALIGSNGAGKSTLLRVVAGTLSPTSGHVDLLDEPLAGLSRMGIARRLAVVPQAAALPFATRVEEVVGLGRLPHEDPFRGPRAADHAVISTEAEYFSLQGVEQALEVVELAKDSLNPDLEWLGVVLNIADMRLVHAREALKQLQERFGDKVFDAVIRRSVAYAESAERGVSIVDRRPDLAEDYLDLAEEALDRLGLGEQHAAVASLR